MSMTVSFTLVCVVSLASGLLIGSVEPDATLMFVTYALGMVAGVLACQGRRTP